MASSTTGQDETKSRAMLGYPSGQDGAFWRSFCRCFLCHTINPLLTKLVRSRWLNIGLVILLRFYGPRRSLGFPVSRSLSRGCNGETSAGFRRVSYHACAGVSLTTSDAFLTWDTTHRTGLRAKLKLKVETRVCCRPSKFPPLTRV